MLLRDERRQQRLARPRRDARRRTSALRSVVTQRKEDETMRSSIRHSLAARRSGLITGGVVFVVVYRALARQQRLARIERKLDAAVD